MKRSHTPGRGSAAFRRTKSTYVDVPLPIPTGSSRLHIAGTFLSFSRSYCTQHAVVKVGLTMLRWGTSLTFSFPLSHLPFPSFHLPPLSHPFPLPLTSLTFLRSRPLKYSAALFPFFDHCSYTNSVRWAYYFGPRCNITVGYMNMRLRRLLYCGNIMPAVSMTQGGPSYWEGDSYKVTGGRCGATRTIRQRDFGTATLSTANDHSREIQDSETEIWHHVASTQQEHSV